MFYSINLIHFGEKVCQIRKRLNLSQHTVSEQSGLNVDTLRRIEKGLVLPKIDTLLILSSIYRIDLLQLFQRECSNEILSDIYSNLDRILSSSCTYTIIKFCDDSIRFLKQNTTPPLLVVAFEKEQLLCLLEGIKYRLAPSNLFISNDLLMKGIKYTHPHFNIDTIDSFNFTDLELRILYLIAANYLDLNQLDYCHQILSYLLSVENLMLSLPLKIKTYALISYNYFLKGLHSESLAYSDKGLALASSNQTTYYVHSLLARKAVALKKLGQAGFEENMKLCLEILKFENNHDLINHYKSISKERYGITL